MGEPPQGLQTAGKIVCVDEVFEVRFELLAAVVVAAFDGGFLDGAVHAFHLPVGPWMLDFGQAVFDAVFAAAHVEHVGHVPSRGTIGIAGWKGELDTVVGQHRYGSCRERQRSGRPGRPKPMSVRSCGQAKCTRVTAKRARIAPLRPVMTVGLAILLPLVVIATLFRLQVGQEFGYSDVTQGPMGRLSGKDRLTHDVMTAE